MRRRLPRDRQRLLRRAVPSRRARRRRGDVLRENFILAVHPLVDFRDVVMFPRRGAVMNPRGDRGGGGGDRPRARRPGDPPRVAVIHLAVGELAHDHGRPRAVRRARERVAVVVAVVVSPPAAAADDAKAFL